MDKRRNPGLRLKARQRCTKAIMRASAERLVVNIVPCDIEPVRFVIDRRVVISAAKLRRDRLFGRNRLTAELYVTQRDTTTLLNRAVAFQVIWLCEHHHEEYHEGKIALFGGKLRWDPRTINTYRTLAEWRVSKTQHTFRRLISSW